jgi:hypothetical protein
VLPDRPRLLAHRGRPALAGHDHWFDGLGDGLRPVDLPDRSWKGSIVTGTVLLVLGFGLLSTIDHETNMVLIGTYLALLGLGLGMTMQGLRR